MKGDKSGLKKEKKNKEKKEIRKIQNFLHDNTIIRLIFFYTSNSLNQYDNVLSYLSE